MHTDESWLAGLSRAMSETKNPAVTEPFFNLVYRAPHAIKIFFHLIQILFIRIFGYRLFSLRLFSVLCGTASLAVFAGLLKRLKQKILPGVLMLSFQIQFIYASHFARQEIQILLLMLVSLYILMHESGPGESAGDFRRGILAGTPVAIAAGFHPNAFIAAWPAGLLLLSDIIRRRRKLREGTGYLIVPALSAGILIMLSLYFNKGFISDYGSFGEEVGFFDPLDIKLLGFDDFYRKLFLRISGTYYTPNILPVFILAGVSGLLYLAQRIFRSPREAIQRKTAGLAVTGIVGVNAGIILIGKYSAPSVVFLIPFLILLTVAGIGSLQNAVIRKCLYSAAISILLLNSILMFFEDAPYKNETYKDFTRQINTAIPPLSGPKTVPEHRVLGPLTAEFALEYGRLLDWRNLAKLSEAGLSIDEYINDNNIEYIIYTEEIDLIYRNRPVWNLLYGNPAIYYTQLQDFLKNSCERVYEFESPGYGTRIVLHRFAKEWKVEVFRVIR